MHGAVQRGRRDSTTCQVMFDAWCSPEAFFWEERAAGTGELHTYVACANQYLYQRSWMFHLQHRSRQRHSIRAGGGCGSMGGCVSFLQLTRCGTPHMTAVFRRMSLTFPSCPKRPFVALSLCVLNSLCASTRATFLRFVDAPLLLFYHGHACGTKLL